MLDPFPQLFQQCWGHALSLRKVYKDSWVVSMLGVVASVRRPLLTRTQQLAQQCCELLRPFAHSLTSNVRFEFVGFTLGVECIINTAVVNIAARGAVPPVAPKRTGSGRAPILCTGNRSGILFECKG